MTDADPGRAPGAALPPVVPRLGRAARRTSCSRATRPTSPPSSPQAGVAPVDDPPAWPAGAHRGRISVRPGRGRRARPSARRDRTCSWLAEVGVGTVHVARRPRRALAAARAAAEADGGWLLREAGAPEPRRFGVALPNLEAHARGSRTRSTRPASSTRDGSRSCRERGVTSADARPRRGRARRVRGVRALPAALPDVPRDRPRDRVAPRAASRRCGRSSSTARRSTTRSATRWTTCVSAAAARPRARRRCSSATSWRAHARCAIAAAPRRCRAGSSSGSAYRVVLPHHALLLALTWLLAVAQRLHLVPRRFGLPQLSLRSLRTPLGGRPGPGRVPVHRLRDGRVAARRPPRRARGDARRRRAIPGSPGAGGDCCGALHVHAGRDARSARGWPAGDRVDAGRRAGRRRQRGLRRGDEGLRPPARHRRGPRVLGPGRATSRSGSPRSRPLPLRDTRRRRSWCRTRATSATCSRPTARCAPCSAPAYGLARDRRRRPVLRRRRRVQRHGARAVGRDPRPQGRRNSGRRRRWAISSWRRPTRAVRCTLRRPA